MAAAVRIVYKGNGAVARAGMVAAWTSVRDGDADPVHLAHPGHAEAEGSIALVVAHLLHLA